MIHTLKLCARHSGRVSGPDKLSFPPGYTVIAGPNGSGKSTLLRAIHECEECRWAGDGDGAFFYFDSETMNPHRSDDAHSGWPGSLIKVRAMFSSHGETMRDVLSLVKFKAGDTLLLDEPESGHDLEWAIRIHKGVLRIVRGGVQVIAASHHPVFWHKAHLIELRKNYIERARLKWRDRLS
ncbi:MAG: AAA family ATPase [Candidatus Omnitrophica bacterium]|nr:AAA family ATPase [Candidatus Omnitrophota bacterium]MCB9720273.1 AAA family ATPase [Candidatus Omnitrophota bacterium]